MNPLHAVFLHRKVDPRAERTLLEGTEKLEEWRQLYDKLNVKELV